MKELIDLIAEKHRIDGIKISPSASNFDITEFENKVGFNLPQDFREFYLICNGFNCEEDIFNIMSLPEITDRWENYDDNWFYFSEYMIYSDMWGIRITEAGKYEIFNGSYPKKAMTSSLEEFLKKFLKGNVFDSGGLYDWHEELEIK